MDINGWDDLGMDWSNPDPRSYTYVYALWEAINQRCNAFQPYKYSNQPNKPKIADICNYDYLRTLVDQVRNFVDNNVGYRVLGSSPWIYIDSDLETYYKDFTRGKPTSLNNIPRRASADILPAELQDVFHLAKRAAYWDDWKIIFIKLKQILSLLRYTKLTNFQAQFNYKFGWRPWLWFNYSRRL